jgi:hypothetical protein
LLKVAFAPAPSAKGALAAPPAIVETAPAGVTARMRLLLASATKTRPLNQPVAPWVVAEPRGGAAWKEPVS